MSILKKGLVLAAATFSVAAFANPLSGLSGNVSTVHGSIDGAETHAQALSVQVPVASIVGVQLDGMYGEFGGTSVHGGAVQLYTRGDKGMVSADYRYTEFGRGNNDESAGLKAEMYSDRVTLKAKFHHHVGGVNKGEGYGIGATIYPADNLALSSFASKFEIENPGISDAERYGFAAEYQTPVRGLAVFATLSEGKNPGSRDYEAATAGVRYYVGADKTLKERHRTGDLENAFLDNTRAFSIY